MVETCNSLITTGGGTGWVVYMCSHPPGYYRLLKSKSCSGNTRLLLSRCSLMRRLKPLYSILRLSDAFCPLHGLIAIFSHYGREISWAMP